MADVLVLVITPVVVVPKDQVWYYSREWQEAEKAADKELKEGRMNAAKTVEQLYKDLGLDK
jgi:antitoxin MazE